MKNKKFKVMFFDDGSIEWIKYAMMNSKVMFFEDDAIKWIKYAMMNSKVMFVQRLCWWWCNNMYR